MLPATQAEPPPRRPDVIMVVLDTTRADRSRFLDPAAAAEPALRALGAESLAFREAWSPAGWTAPAHASLFTGLRPVRHRLIESRSLALAPEATTLAEILRDAGYQTACFSNNPVVSDRLGLTQGFGHTPVLTYGAASRGAPEAHRLALEFLEQTGSAGRPRFVFVNDFEPHLAYQPPPAAAARTLPPGAPRHLVEMAREFDDDDALQHTLGAQRLDPGAAALLPPLYQAEVTSLEDEVLRFVGELRRRGILDNALLVICADHGENLGEHGLWSHRFSLHRSICRVPLVIRPPGGMAGRVVDDVVRLEDVLPTVLETCRLPLPAKLDGASLLGPTDGRVARGSYGPNISIMPRALAMSPDLDTTLFRREIRTVFDGRYHLIVTNDGIEQLFDVAPDPEEELDLAPELPDEVRRLRALLDPW